MTYIELHHKAERLLDDNKITLGEYEKMIEPLEREISEWIPVSETMRADSQRLILIATTIPSGGGRETLLTGCRCRARRRQSDGN